MVFIVLFFFLYSINYEDLLHVASLNEANLLLMGCCKSSSDIEILHLDSTNSARIDSTLTQTEKKQLEIFLSEIPDHCRQIIVDLPARQLLNTYQYHTMALQHGLKREWSLAISCEHRVLKGLQTLLPTQKDHYIFFYFYTVLSASFLALGEFEAAIEGLYIALAILLKYTPTDYRTISGYYRHLANAFRILQEWKATAYYLIKAIATARLMTDFDQEYIGILEAELQIAKERIANDVSRNLTFSEVKRKQGENDHDFRRRRTAEIIISNAKYRHLLYFHEDEFERLPDNINQDCISNDC